MKGVVFNVLEQVVSAEHGEDTWDRLLDEADLDGAYTSLGSYEDADRAKALGPKGSAAADRAHDPLAAIGTMCRRAPTSGLCVRAYT